MTELIRPEIADKAVPAPSVTPFPGNARRGDLDKIKNSLRKHGQYKPLLVQKSTGYILVGNNTYAAMLDLGYESVAVDVLDVDDAKAREMLLIDNASSDDAIYDETALAALLADVGDWDASGWTPDDLDDLLVKLEQGGGDPAALAAALPQGVAPPQTLPEVPVTDARYAESPEDEDKRQEKFDTWTPRYAKGLTEVILVYPEETRAEVLALITKIKTGTGSTDAHNGDVVLGALRLLGEVVTAHGRGDLAVDVETALAVGTPPKPPASPEGQAAAAAEEQAEVAADTAAAED